MLIMSYFHPFVTSRTAITIARSTETAAMHKRPAITSDVLSRLTGMQRRLNAEQTNKKALGQRARNKELQAAITLSTKIEAARSNFE
jgi:hypothetical protein